MRCPIVRIGAIDAICANMRDGSPARARREATMGSGPKPKPFEYYVRPDGECLVWHGVRDRCGYGQRRHNGASWRAHRVAWTMAYGDIPDGLLVLHKCDRPPCVRLDHLFLGSYRDNGSDRSRKLRSAGTKLTREQADAVLALKKSGMSHGELSGLFHIDPAAISKLVNRKTYQSGGGECSKQQWK